MPKQVGIHPTDGTTISPESYQLNVMIYSADGKERDITGLVTSMTVYESIFQQSLIAEFDIADGISLFEDLNITGNEKISTVITKQMDKATPPEEIQNDWYVLDIPLFTRPKPDIQAYKIRGVTPLGLVSKFRRISHVLSGTPIDIISSLYDQLGSKVELYGEVAVGVMKYIPPRLTYADAINNMLKKTVAPDGSPFFAYQTLEDSKYRLRSYNDMVLSSSLEIYTHASFYSGETQADEAFEEKGKRILEVSSRLGFSAYTGMKHGSYITRTHSLDWNTKEYKTIDYNAFDTKPRMIDGDESELVWNSDFSVSGVGPDNLKEVHNIYISNNSYAMIETEEYNIHHFSPYTAAKKDSVYSNLEQMEHTIKLHGDVRLSSGSIINLNFPQLGMVQEPGNSDPFLSGRYLIVSATHVFNNSGYFINLKVRRDSVHKR